MLDGNTIQVSCFCEDNDVRKVSLVGIDSPELGQEFGEEARKFLEKMILRKDVECNSRGRTVSETTWLLSRLMVKLILGLNC